MKLTLKTLAGSTLKCAVTLLVLINVVACQQQESSKEVAATKAPSDVTNTLVTEKRPAPTFYIIPEDLAKKRVWLLEDGQSDIFHLKHDCPVLVAGKGKGTFKNVTLTRAIEEYGRYNCQECSSELNHIFDENMVR
ncbi:hypothetical protein ACSX1A_01545 [Pontibacter sp. MBLB2868]|uniref:hypothetical protein n=1 Tax=Pontibacter sp. MBLB2868 TaxID=3451555 RepID=UPI003F74E224